MIVEPKIRGFICTTAHPEGCRENVTQQIDFVKSRPKTNGAKNALIIGASAGYGLSSRITAAFSCNASTLGVIFDKPASAGRTASAGWYNTAAFEEFAHADGLYAKTVNGDAFSREVKEQVIECIRRDLKKIDLVIYSLAAPRRTMPDGTVRNSVLKTTGGDYTNQTIDLKTGILSAVTIPPATEQEITDTVSVMGGEDWSDWMHALKDAGVLAENAVTVAYSYIGPELTHPIYLNGSIGMAKKHLYDTAGQLRKTIAGLSAYISVNKALVTQSSAAIPVVPLYISILYKIMKEKKIHEGCTEQMYRLFHDKLYTTPPVLDEAGQLRLDDWEMQDDVQAGVQTIWSRLNQDMVSQAADLDGYWEDFYRMFGFHVPGVDYTKESQIQVPIPSILE